MQNSGAGDLLRTLSEGRLMFGWLKSVLSGNALDKRASASGFTAEIVAARESLYQRPARHRRTDQHRAKLHFLSGKTGCHWRTVTGPNLLDRRSLAILRAVPLIKLRGERRVFSFEIDGPSLLGLGSGKTRHGRPTRLHCRVGIENPLGNFKHKPFRPSVMSWPKDPT